MALSATQHFWEPPVEQRIAQLETHIEHMHTDISDIKTTVRDMRMETRQDILRLDGKVDALKDSFASAKVWALVLYIGLAAALLSTMTMGFLWLANKL